MAVRPPDRLERVVAARPELRADEVDTKPEFIYIAYFPAFIFWILDGYFLWQECLFRKLYDHVRALDEKDIDFSMDTSAFESEVPNGLKFAFSTTLRLFHGAVIGAIIIVMIVLVKSSGA